MTVEMDRGTDALKSHVSDAGTMTFRQAPRCSQWKEPLCLLFCFPCMICCCGSEPPAEFQVYVGENHVAEATEDDNGRCRFWCAPIHPFQTVVKEVNTEAEMITVDRPFRCPFFCCKCCCYQVATVASGGQELGRVKEDCFVCVPSFKVMAPDGTLIYKVHPPTCYDGHCIDCCMEEYPNCCEDYCCSHKQKQQPWFACCRIPFHVFPASQVHTGDLAPHIGKIFKPFERPGERRADIFAVQINFPEGATPQEKGLLMGSALFLNASFFEEPVNNWEEGRGEGGD
ncbi:phospholipid scramblase [Fragilaria crotonensis]|nr:phospholipid scramblase [Fragilaria crotonensis]